MDVLYYLDRVAERTPEKVAFADDIHEVTYLQLQKASKSIGTALAMRLNDVNMPVAVLIDRNVESICAFVGVASSRNFYVPLDVSLPVQRMRAILSQMQPMAVISIGDNLPQELKDELQVPVYPYEELLAQPADEFLISKRRSEILDIDPLYAIYTSGSTGVPKGVLKPHISVLDFIPEFVKTFNMDESDVFGNQAPFDFDVSVKDIYSTIYCGASMYIIPRGCFTIPKKLVDVLNERKITTLVWAVSALCIAAKVNVFKYKTPAYLKRVLFSGEVMPIKLLNIWRQALPDVMYVNLYGPTEVTCNCLYYIVDREFCLTERLPLGVPFENQEVYVLGDGDRPIGPGEVGEICVKGTCLAMGYYRDPERTAQVFVQNPANKRYPERIYRTGDLAELTERGEYRFVARKDFQIKHMGRRIELEEIEIYLGAVPGVTRASCLYDAQREKIVAYYTGDAEKAVIFGKLKESIPKYMMPNIFYRMENLPINKNGKIDRQKLREEYQSRQKD